MPSWNTAEETAWLVENFLPRFKGFDRSGKVEFDGQTLAPMKAFKREIVTEFGKAFPYRHPKTDVSKYSEELQALQFSNMADWNALGEKFRHRLNYLKNHHDEGTSDVESERAAEDSNDSGTDAEDDGSIAKSAETDAEPEQPVVLRRTSQRLQKLGKGTQATRVPAGKPSRARNPQLPATKSRILSDQPEETSGGLDESTRLSEDDRSTSTRESMEAAGDETTLNEDLAQQLHQESLGQSDDYQPTSHTFEEWQEAMAMLKDMMECSWAECSAEHLNQRRKELPLLCTTLMEILAYGTGAELYATGLTATRNDFSTFQTVSPRSQYFVTSKQAQDARSTFARFVASYIGPGLCTTARCPGPAVYGDPERQNHPVLPPAFSGHHQNQLMVYQYLSLKLQWQGGGVEVPYKLIEEEAKLGRFSIVTHEALPESIPYLRSPFRMDSEDLSILMQHIRQSDTFSLPPNRRFQFAEPRPDCKLDTYMVERPDDGSVAYSPFASAYYSFLTQSASTEPRERRDGLPIYDRASLSYQSFTSEDINTWTTLLRNNEHCSDQSDWTRRILGMPHLKASPPGDYDSIEHLCDSKGWLPLEFFDPEYHNHPLFGLTPLLEWCDPMNFLHTPSNTLSGGPFGYKWAVLILAHVWRNCQLVVANDPMVEAHYGHNGPSTVVPEGYGTRIAAAVTKLALALEESTRRLRVTYEERGEPDPVLRAQLASRRRHADFRMSTLQVRQTGESTTDNKWSNCIARSPSSNETENLETADTSIPSTSTTIPNPLTGDQKGKKPADPRRAPKRPLSTGDPSSSGSPAKGPRLEPNEKFQTNPANETMETDQPILGMKSLAISPRAARTLSNDMAGGRSKGD